MQTATARRFPHVPAGTGRAYDVIGELLTFKVTNADTGGRFTVVELLAQPGGRGTARAVSWAVTGSASSCKTA